MNKIIILDKKEKLNRLIERIVDDKQSNFYLINKPKNIHSFKAVSVIRKILDIKKVGFAGTLDPLASGLLIIATGKATKLLDYFHNLPKTYIAEILFGQISDTYDLEGKISVNNNVNEFNKEELEKSIEKFLGKQKQQAPLFSAKKIKGKKLHILARQGKKIEPPFKEIEIYSLKVLNFEYPNLELKITCSVGTYIRSLAHDLGKELKTGALLSNLKRVSIGDFLLDNSIDLNNLNLNTLEKNKLDINEVIKILNLESHQQLP